MVWIRRRRLAGVSSSFLAVATLACSDTPAGVAVPAAVDVAVGDAQTGNVAQTLPSPVSVRVVDGGGAPVAGVTVSWQVSHGGGTASPTVGRTSVDGLASTIWTLGPAAGEQRLVARVAGLPDLTVTATGEPGPPARIALSTDAVVLVLEDGRDEIVLMAEVFDAFDNPTGAPVDWSVDDAAVAEVDAYGRVRAVGGGFTVVRASSGDLATGASITVENPVPILESLAPTSVMAGSDDITLGLDGRGFVPTSIVFWNGSPRPTAFVNPTRLTADIDAADLTAAGDVSVTVTNATPGGGSSLSVSFVVEPRVPTLRILSSAITVPIDSWIDIAVEARDIEGTIVPDPEIEWTILDAGLEAFVDGARGGTARTRAVGVARLAADWSGFAVDTVEVRVVGIDARITNVSAGSSLTCGFDDRRSVYCWGWHFRGLTPDGRYSYSSSTFAPSPLAGGRILESLATGFWHACGLDAAGVAWCWFDDNYQQLGQGARLPTGGSTEPLQVTGGLRFRTLAAGGWHTCGATFDDEAWCWGHNSYAQLGTGDQQDRSAPTRLAGDIPLRALFLGGWHTCGLTSEEEAYCWGYNGHGQLGRPTGETCDDPLYGKIPCGFTPAPVATSLRFTTLAVGGDFTCGLTASGEAWCWGSGTRGQLGDGVTGESAAPVRVTASASFTDIGAGYGYACGLTASGEVHCWGENDYGTTGRHPFSSGQCVENNTIYACDPLPVLASGVHSFGTLNTGLRHVCGVATTGRVLCWGADIDGQLGRGGPGETYFRADPGPVYDGWMATLVPVANRGVQIRPVPGDGGTGVHAVTTGHSDRPEVTAPAPVRPSTGWRIRGGR